MKKKALVIFMLLSSLCASQDNGATEQWETPPDTTSSVSEIPVKEIIMSEQEKRALTFLSSTNKPWYYSNSTEGVIEITQEESDTQTQTKETLILSALNAGDTYLTLTNGDKKLKYHIMVFQD
jgi:hypothetical protein